MIPRPRGASEDEVAAALAAVQAYLAEERKREEQAEGPADLWALAGRHEAQRLVASPSSWAQARSKTFPRLPMRNAGLRGRDWSVGADPCGRPWRGTTLIPMPLQTNGGEPESRVGRTDGMAG